MARILCDDAVTNKLAMVPLSNDTIKRRIQKISEDVLQQTIASVKRSGNFSLQLDETVAYAESFRGGAKVLSQSCDVTNQLGECRRHSHYRVVRGHAPKKFCKITPKNTHFSTGQIGSFSKTKKAFAQWWIFKFRGPTQEFPKIDVL